MLWAGIIGFSIGVAIVVIVTWEVRDQFVPRYKELLGLDSSRSDGANRRAARASEPESIGRAVLSLVLVVGVASLAIGLVGGYAAAAISGGLVASAALVGLVVNRRTG